VPAKGSRGPWLWPLLMAAVGIILLLNNFLLLGDFNALTLLPLLLVVAGAVVLLRGDFIPSSEIRTFGITRGSVESATLEVNAGEIDVRVRPIQQEGRLIAGQFALASRPTMRVTETHTHLQMDRSATPWISFSDWEMGLARDLPWQILVSTSLGQINLNLAELILQEGHIASGIGDIRLISPHEALGAISIRSTLGNIHVVTPLGYRTRITIQTGHFFKSHVDERRYEQVEPGIYDSLGADEQAPLVEINLHGTFGDAYLT
jgi:hypothetical protein